MSEAPAISSHCSSKLYSVSWNAAWAVPPSPGLAPAQLGWRWSWTSCPASITAPMTRFIQSSPYRMHGIGSTKKVALSWWRSSCSSCQPMPTPAGSSERWAMPSASSPATWWRHISSVSIVRKTWVMAQA
jgi:hypothetical protein